MDGGGSSGRARQRSNSVGSVGEDDLHPDVKALVPYVLHPRRGGVASASAIDVAARRRIAHRIMEFVSQQVVDRTFLNSVVTVTDASKAGAAQLQAGYMAIAQRVFVLLRLVTCEQV